MPTLAELTAMRQHLDSHLANRRATRVDMSVCIAVASAQLSRPATNRDPAMLQAALHALACVFALRSTTSGAMEVTESQGQRSFAVAHAVVSATPVGPATSVERVGMPQPPRTVHLALILLVNMCLREAEAKLVQRHLVRTLEKLRDGSDDPRCRSLSASALHNCEQHGGFFGAFVRRSAKMVSPAAILATIDRLEAGISAGEAPPAPARIPKPLSAAEADAAWAELAADAEAQELVDTAARNDAASERTNKAWRTLEARKMGKHIAQTFKAVDALHAAAKQLPPTPRELPTPPAVDGAQLADDLPTGDEGEEGVRTDADTVELFVSALRDLNAELYAAPPNLLVSHLCITMRRMSLQVRCHGTEARGARDGRVGREAEGRRAERAGLDPAARPPRDGRRACGRAARRARGGVPLRAA